MKRLFKSIFVVSFILATSGVALGQQKFEWKEASEGGYSYKYVANDPTQSRFYTLKNGLTVILSPSKKRTTDPDLYCHKSG